MTTMLAPPQRFAAVSTRTLRSQREVTAMVRAYRKQPRYSSVVDDFCFRPGFLYNTVRAISARVNQNYDAWPSVELKKSYRTFLGKPCFVNHRNEDPTKARGRVVAARYIEKGADRYIDVIQEIDALRFPKLAHEIRTGGLDSVSMGVEAGFTICSICENRATDIFDMCNHVKFHKGEYMRHPKTGKRTLVYENCYKLGFFELSYVFDPADETAVVSRVIAANRHHANEDMADPNQWSGAGTHSVHETPDGHKLMVFPPDSKVSPLPGEKPRPAQWEWAHLQGKPIPGTHFLDHEVVNHGVAPREDVARQQAMDSYKASQAADRLDADAWDPDRDPHDPRYDPKLGGHNPYLNQFWGEDLNEADWGLPEDVKAFTMHHMYDEPHHTGRKTYGDFTPFRGRSYTDGQQVRAYRNLHNGKWSVRAMEGPDTGRILGHASELHLNPAEFKVSEAGRQRVLRDKAKNVHAFVQGVMVPDAPEHQSLPYQGVTYNPYKYNSFVHRDTEEPIAAAEHVHLAPDGRAYAVNPVGKDGAQVGSPDRTARRRQAADGLPGGNATMPSIPQITPTPGGASFPRPTIGPGNAAGVTQGTKDGPNYISMPDGSSFLPGKNVQVETPYEWSHDSDNPAAVKTSRQWLAYGEVRVPDDVDTLRDEDETETSDGMKDPFHHWISSPEELQDPDTSRAKRLDKRQEDQGLDDDRRVEDVEEFGVPSPHDREDPEYTDPEHEDDDQLAMPINPPAPRKGRRMTRGAPMSRSYRYAADEDESYPDDGDYQSDDGSGYSDDGSNQGYGDDQGYDDGSDQDYGDDQGGDDGSDPDALVTEAEQDLADYEHEQAAGDDGSYESDDSGYDDGGDDSAPPWADDGSGDDMGDSSGDSYDDGSEQPYDDGGGDAPPWEDNRQARRRRGRPVKKRGARGKRRGSQGGGMSRQSLATRQRTAQQYGNQPRRHFQADDSGHTDGGPYGVDDSQGLQEDVFISQVPSAEAVDMPADDADNISNTKENLVARRRRQANPMTGDFDPAHYQKLADSVASLPPEQRAQVALHMAKTLVADNPRFNWRTFFTAAKVPPVTRQAMRFIAEELEDPDKVDPSLSGTDVQDLKGDEFESLALDDVETQPKDASVHAFRQFDSWLKQVTGGTCRDHGNANYIRRAAVTYANRFRQREAALAGLFPTLEYVLREARKVEASKNRRGNVHRYAEDTSLEVAAPDGRVDVEAPVKNVTDADAQASQFDLGDYAQNAGDDIADPVLDVVDGNAGTWAPDEGGSKEASVRLASASEAMRCAMAYQEAMPRKYGGKENLFRLTARFETLRSAAVRERTRLLEEVARENRASRRKVTAGRSRGTNGIPMNLASRPTRTAASNARDFVTDPSTDYALYT